MQQLASTYTSRIDIGFRDRSSWREAPAYFDDHSLTIQGHPVMEDWEDSYMQELARLATSNGGRVLEVGFGMGISARHIQTHDIEEHLIIEANYDVFTRSEEFARTAQKPVVPLFGFWEEVVRALPSNSFSGILFDTYPLCEAEIHINHFPFFKQAYRLLAPGGVLTYYSDEVSDFSPAHLAALHKAGFKQIEKTVCSVTPPENCAYWKSPTILAPCIRK